jgi:hypothetical protein
MRTVDFGQAVEQSSSRGLTLKLPCLPCHRNLVNLAQPVVALLFPAALYHPSLSKPPPPPPPPRAATAREDEDEDEGEGEGEGEGTTDAIYDTPLEK